MTINLTCRSVNTALERAGRHAQRLPAQRLPKNPCRNGVGSWSPLFHEASHHSFVFRCIDRSFWDCLGCHIVPFFSPGIAPSFLLVVSLFPILTNTLRAIRNRRNRLLGEPGLRQSGLGGRPPRPGLGPAKVGVGYCFEIERCAIGVWVSHALLVPLLWSRLTEVVPSVFLSFLGRMYSWVGNGYRL